MGTFWGSFYLFCEADLMQGLSQLSLQSSSADLSWPELWEMLMLADASLARRCWSLEELSSTWKSFLPLSVSISHVHPLLNSIEVSSSRAIITKNLEFRILEFSPSEGKSSSSVKSSPSVALNPNSFFCIYSQIEVLHFKSECFEIQKIIGWKFQTQTHQLWGLEYVNKKKTTAHQRVGTHSTLVPPEAQLESKHQENQNPFSPM